MKRLIEMDIEHACRIAFANGAKKRAPGGPWWGDPPAEEAFGEMIDAINYVKEMEGDPRFDELALWEAKRLLEDLARFFQECAKIRERAHYIPSPNGGMDQPEVRQAVSHEGEC